jgi:predicted GH43/DUF377 family glycosyl hydrolase
MSHEAGAVALYRKEGILLMYNASDYPGYEGWQLGQVLIDKTDMQTAIKETEKPFLYPEKAWELEGDIDAGASTIANGIVFFKEKWIIYYGGGDHVIGMATFEPKGSFMGNISLIN